MGSMNEERKISDKELRRLFNKGLKFHAKGDFIKAIEIFEKIVDISPEVLTAWYNMGIAYQYLGNYHKAIDLYKIALNIDPKLSEAWYCLGVAYFKLGNRREAMSAIKNAKKLNPALTGESPNNLPFSFLRLPEDSHLFQSREVSSYQFIDGTTEGEIPNFCANCGNKQWKRLIENSVVKLICLSCGYEIIVGRIHRTIDPPVTADHWSGSQDDIERILEKEYEKGKR